MNLVLIRNSENTFYKDDERFIHIKEILKLKSGDNFKCGIINGKIGVGKILNFTDQKITFDFTPQTNSDELLQFTVVCGLVRPIHAKRILKDIATLGIKRLIFFNSDTGEKSYRNSNLFKMEEIENHLIKGAEQGYISYLPKVDFSYSLKSVFEKENFTNMVCLHNSTDSINISNFNCELPMTIFIGSERGWSNSEIDFLKSKSVPFVSMGKRVLKTEMAVSASIEIFSYKQNLL